MSYFLRPELWESSNLKSPPYRITITTYQLPDEYSWHDVLEEHERDLSDDQIESLEFMIDSMVSGSICSTPLKG